MFGLGTCVFAYKLYPAVDFVASPAMPQAADWPSVWPKKSYSPKRKRVWGGGKGEVEAYAACPFHIPWPCYANYFNRP